MEEYSSRSFSARTVLNKGLKKIDLKPFLKTVHPTVFGIKKIQVNLRRNLVCVLLVSIGQCHFKFVMYTLLLIVYMPI